MAVRTIESLDRGARHEERLENSVIHGVDALPGNALVVIGVPAIQVDTLPLSQAGIEHHREKFRQHAGIEALGEGLAFAFILLAMALDPVPENLVEENTGGSAGENGRAKEGLDNRRMYEAGQVAAYASDRSQQNAVGRQFGWIGGVETH